MSVAASHKRNFYLIIEVTFAFLGIIIIMVTPLLAIDFVFSYIFLVLSASLIAGLFFHSLYKSKKIINALEIDLQLKNEEVNTVQKDLSKKPNELKSQIKQLTDNLEKKTVTVLSKDGELARIKRKLTSKEQVEKDDEKLLQKRFLEIRKLKEKNNDLVELTEENTRKLACYASEKKVLEERTLALEKEIDELVERDDGQLNNLTIARKQIHDLENKISQLLEEKYTSSGSKENIPSLTFFSTPSSSSSSVLFSPIPETPKHTSRFF